MARVNKAKPRVVLHLLQAQLFLAILFQAKFNLLGAIFGQVLTVLFLLIFPISFFSFPLRWVGIDLPVWGLSLFHSIAIGMGKLSLGLGLIPGPMLLIAIFWKSKWSMPLALLITAQPLGKIVRRSPPKQNIERMFHAWELKEIRYRRSGIKLRLFNGTRCSAKLHGSYYRYRCH